MLGNCEDTQTSACCGFLPQSTQWTEDHSTCRAQRAFREWTSQIVCLTWKTGLNSEGPHSPGHAGFFFFCYIKYWRVCKTTAVNRTHRCPLHSCWTLMCVRNQREILDMKNRLHSSGSGSATVLFTYLFLFIYYQPSDEMSCDHRVLSGAHSRAYRRTG